MDKNYTGARSAVQRLSKCISHGSQVLQLCTRKREILYRTSWKLGSSYGRAAFLAVIRKLRSGFIPAAVTIRDRKQYQVRD